MGLFVVGDVDPSHVVQILARTFGREIAGAGGNLQAVYIPRTLSGERPLHPAPPLPLPAKPCARHRLCQPQSLTLALRRARRRCPAAPPLRSPEHAGCRSSARVPGGRGGAGAVGDGRGDSVGDAARRPRASLHVDLAWRVLPAPALDLAAQPRLQAWAACVPWRDIAAARDGAAQGGGARLWRTRGGALPRHAPRADPRGALPRRADGVPRLGEV